MQIRPEDGRMISRYNRRPVSHKLEIRGLSRNSLDHHPLPEEVDDVHTPQHYLHDLQEAVSTHNSSQTSAASPQSDCPTVVTGDINQSWSGIHSYTGTGISTERSSVFSWGYDEFDNAASRQVQQMFEEIDRELYEGRGGAVGPQLRGLQDECQQWAARFPHLRILGTQLVCPSDEGFQWYATSGQATTSSSQPAAEKDSVTWAQDKDRPATELNVQGRRAVLVKPPQAEEPDGPPRDAPGGPPGHDGARVIMAEGLMEEYLAFDSRDLDRELEQEGSELDRRRRCLPPVSPYRCRRQAVLDLLFDDVWRQLVGWMGELVQRHWEGCVSDDEKNLSPGGRQDTQGSFMLPATLPATLLPRLDQTRVPQLTASLQQSQNPKSKDLKHKSRRKSKKQKQPSTVARVPVGATATHQNLNNLIMIHGIPLQQRNLAVLEKAAQEPTEERVDRQASRRPASSAVPSSKSRPRRPLEQSFSSLSRPPVQSSRRRNPPPRTLLPLVPPGLPQSSGVGSMDEVIRGTRLATASDRLSSPLTPLGRNTILPPIGTGEPEASHSAEPAPACHPGPHPRTTQVQDGLVIRVFDSRLKGHGFDASSLQRQRGSSSRTHSAVVDDAGVSHPKDRHHLLLDAFSRPNTTHTYRSDTPYRRSFTVLDNIGQGRPGRVSIIDSLGIGVTGISLGISSSSFLDSFSHHPLGHSPIEDEEEPGPAAPLPAVPASTSVPPRAHPRGGPSSRSSRPGF